MRVAVVVPVYNESGVAETFLQRLHAEISLVSGPVFEFIVVDDGSTDDTYVRLRALATRLRGIRVIRLFRNRGHQRALVEGLRSSQADAVLMLDGDGQHPAPVARRLVERWLAQPSLDVVQAVRREGQQGRKAFFSRLFYAVVRHTVPGLDLISGESDFRLVSADVARVLVATRHSHRNLRVFLGTLRVQKDMVVYDAEPRLGGTSKYTLRKMLRLAVDGIFGFTYLPLRVSLWISFLLGGASLGIFAHAMAVWMQGGTVPGWTSLIGLLCLCFCGVFAVLAILAEYVIMIYETVLEPSAADPALPSFCGMPRERAVTEAGTPAP